MQLLLTAIEWSDVSPTELPRGLTQMIGEKLVEGRDVVAFHTVAARRSKNPSAIHRGVNDAVEAFQIMVDTAPALRQLVVGSRREEKRCARAGHVSVTDNPVTVFELALRTNGGMTTIQHALSQYTESETLSDYHCCECGVPTVVANASANCPRCRRGPKPSAVPVDSGACDVCGRGPAAFSKSIGTTPSFLVLQPMRSVAGLRAVRSPFGVAMVLEPLQAAGHRRAHGRGRPSLRPLLCVPHVQVGQVVALRRQHGRARALAGPRHG